MYKSILHRIISIWTVVILLFPIGLQLIHALENHEHIVCSSKTDHHIHNQTLDCSVNHVQLDNSTLFHTLNFEVIAPSISNKLPLYYLSKNYNTQLYYTSTRGPPFIV